MSWRVTAFGRVLLIGLCVSLGVSADEGTVDPTLQAVVERIERPPLLRASFVQARQIEGFSRPLRSSGRFLLARDRGLLWLTEQPFASRLSLTASGLRVQEAGAERRLDSAAEPALAAVHQLLMALLGGELARLQAEFEIAAGENDAAGWQLSLRPRGPPYALLIEQIELSGTTQVERVLLHERNGDRSELQFSDFATGPAPDAQEAAQLAAE